MEHLLPGGSGPLYFTCVCTSVVWLVIPDPESLAADSNRRSSSGLWQQFCPLGAFTMDLSW